MDEYLEAESNGNKKIVVSPEIKSLLASSIPSIFLRAFFQPLEILKIRFQLQQHSVSNVSNQKCFNSIGTIEPYKSMPHAMKVIYENDGFRGFYRGMVFTQCVSTTSTVLQFGVYRKLRRLLHKSRVGQSPTSCDLIAGFLTGSSLAVLVNPLDYIRTHLLARDKEKGKGVIQIARDVYRTGGITQFYSGAYTAMWHAGTLNGLRFMFYNMCCGVAEKYEGVTTHKDLRSYELVLAGFLAGAAANFIAYPMEFIKRRLQSDSVRIKHVHSRWGSSKSQQAITTTDLCRAIIQCVNAVVKAEGIWAFYKGFVPNALKSIISTAVQLSCYDMIYHMVDDLFK